MTTSSVVLLVLAGALALLDWYAVAREDKRLEYVAKPATLLALIGAALALDAVEPVRQAWWLAALVLSLAGDVFLMLPGRFVPGLASFLGGHVAYIGGFLAARQLPLIPPAGQFVVLGGANPVLGYRGQSLALVVVVLGVALLAPRIVRGAARHDRKLALPVTVYLLAISVMVVLAGASGNVLAGAGALLFYASDAMIGLRNFVRERAWHDLAIISTYHLGQALLVVSLAWPVL